MPSNHLDGLSGGEVKEWLKRVNKRERRRKRRSKWSSVPPSCRTLHNRCRGHLDHSARELMFPTKGTLLISLALQGVGRTPAKMALSSQSSAPLQLALRAELGTN
uniref:Uncharacterized protein n=1 Tax=Oryza nivara TaxID=4536 RepID=A0A0E0J609_ORYNI